MSLEKLLDRIKKDALKKARIIKKEAQKEAEEIILEATNVAEKQKKKHLDEVKKRVQIEKESLLARARLDGRDLILRSKRNLLNKAFKNAFNKIDRLSSAEYEKVILKLLINNSKGTEHVLMADSLAPKIVSEANQSLAKLGKTAQLKVSEEKIKEKGFVLEDEHGIRTDFTFDALIDYHLETLEPKVFAILEGEKSSE